MNQNPCDWLDEVQWNEQGLVAAIAQHVDSHRILMMAWMNRESLMLTVQTGLAHYWSRSRGKLWKKGEESGHWQTVQELRLDCDGDAIVMLIQPTGEVACHTGRESCFYRRWQQGSWVTVDAVID